MNTTRLASIAMAGLLVAAGNLYAQDPAEAAAETKTPAERIAPLIDILRQADNPSTAMAAYARGCAIDHTNVDLQNAYMCRMLQFGQPTIAFYAARVLVTLQSDNGAAWGVVGYHHGKRGELADALSANLRAVEHAADNPGILNNAGQLLAWYEHELARPQLTDAARRALERSREQLFQREPFARAYKAMTVAYEERARLSAELEKRLAAADAEAQQIRNAALELDAQLQNITDEINYRSRVIDGLNNDLVYNSPSPLFITEDGKLMWPARSYYSFQAEIQDRIRNEERAVNELKVQARRLRREGESVLTSLQAKTAEIRALADQAKAALARVDRAFRWDPPAVDGVITPARDRLPPPQKVAELPEDPDTAATQQFELGKLYIQNGMNDKGADILRELVKQYPESKAAREAKLVLATVPSPG